jgi:hypothetical protein
MKSLTTVSQIPHTEVTARETQDMTPGRMIFRVAWLAVLLGFTVEAIILLVGGYKGAKPLMADLAQKVSWSSLICAALAFGKSSVKLLGAPLTGLAGLLAAPVAFIGAKGIQGMVSKALLMPTSAATLPSVYVLAGVKGIEYFILGLLITRIDRRKLPDAKNAAAYFSSGAGVGAIFSLIFLALNLTLAPQTPAATDLITRGVNEFIQPIGCAMVLFAAEAMGKGMAR